ncbi:MAG: alpha/beta hydrolase-fold protein [Pirellula sp.]|nr:alpha/beta hydrolase-fold protein [Pirellula sp.]
MRSSTTQQSRLIAIAISTYCLIICNATMAKTSDSEEDNVRVRIEVTIPDSYSVAESEGDLFLSGNIKQLGEWRPNGLKLNRTDEKVYVAEFSIPAASRVQYKVTRGTWATVEKDAAGKDIANRQFVAAATEDEGPQKISIVVQKWGTPTSAKSTITGTLKRHEQISSQFLTRSRNINVWLPPDYEECDKRYPVLYLQDGKNLFDESTAAFGVEWRADESAMELITKQEIPSLIIVGIWNTADRMEEYTLTKDERLNLGGRGLDYIRFVVEELKPLIDRTYRTRIDRESTSIGGSSLGGLIAMHACLEQPDVFGHCLAFSPSLGWDQECLLKSLQNEKKWPANIRLWLSMGTREGRDSESQKQNLARAQRLHHLLSPDVTTIKTSVQFHEFADASHDEKSWSTQLPIALKSTTHPLDDPEK